MTGQPQPCPPAYRSLRDAKAAAWLDATRRSAKPLPPTNCPRCGDWHLTPAPNTTKGA